MSRVKKGIIIDQSKPVDLENFDLTTISSSPDDCFGKLWENTNKTCVDCSVYDLCMVYKFKTQPDDTIYFDLIDWEAIDWEGLESEIKNNSTNYKDIFDLVKETSKCIDNYTVEVKLKYFIESRNLDQWIIY